MGKYPILIVSILCDLIGMASFSIPGIGEFADVIWAPVSAFLIAKLYPTKMGKFGAVISFIEEAMPGMDIVPTFTLLWIYTYMINSADKTKTSSSAYSNVYEEKTKDIDHQVVDDASN